MGVLTGMDYSKVHIFWIKTYRGAKPVNIGFSKSESFVRGPFGALGERGRGFSLSG